MKIAVASLMHETNTFTAHKTPYNHFNIAKDQVFADPYWMKKLAGGMLSYFRQQNADIVPTLFARGIPSGLIEQKAFETMTRTMIEKIKSAWPVDGICLALHGSMHTEYMADPEGALLKQLREQFGYKIPIVCALDMHATVTSEMASMSDGLTVFRTAPHTDEYETGERAARLLHKIIQEKLDTLVERVRLPMLLAGEQSESVHPPMRDLISFSIQCEQDEAILAADYTLGFPWADSPHSGVCVVVSSKRKHQSKAKEVALAMAKRFWEVRDQFCFTTEAHPLTKALHLAMKSPDKPVVIGDSGDNPTAGASEDLSIALAEMIRLNMKNALHAAIVDADAVQICRQAGIGATVNLQLGKAVYQPDAKPLAVQADIISLGRYEQTQAAVLDIQGITVLVISCKARIHDPALLAGMGIDLSRYEILVIKSGYLSPEYQTFAARQMLALTPGDTNELLETIAYEKTPRPIYPLDADTTWP